jgi:hypothetical protein
MQGVLLSELSPLTERISHHTRRHQTLIINNVTDLASNASDVVLHFRAPLKTSVVR